MGEIIHQQRERDRRYLAPSALLGEGSEYFLRKISSFLWTRLSRQEGQSQSRPRAGQETAGPMASPSSPPLRDILEILFDVSLFVCCCRSPLHNIRAALLIDLFDHSGPKSSKWRLVAWLLLRPSSPDSQIFKLNNEELLQISVGKVFGQISYN